MPPWVLPLSHTPRRDDGGSSVESPDEDQSSPSGVSLLWQKEGKFFLKDLCSVTQPGPPRSIPVCRQLAEYISPPFIFTSVGAGTQAIPEEPRVSAPASLLQELEGTAGWLWDLGEPRASSEAPGLWNS